jgi:hypothetical protein
MFSELLAKVLRTAKRTFGGKQQQKQKQNQKQNKTKKRRTKTKGG